ncbi:MAG: amidohydrolase [Bacillota bacterium]
MTDIAVSKARVCEEIERRSDEIIEIGNDIFAHPELGYKEFRTSDIVGTMFKKMGLEFQDGLAITGKKARIPGREHRLNVCIMGELDSVLCPDHPHADPKTGAAHSCGHNAQIASMLGAGFGLVFSGVMSELDGDVTLLAVPSEEYVEIEYRDSLRREGKIKFLGGKQEMIAIGAMDDIDISMLTHLSTFDDPTKKARIGGTSNGFIGKNVFFRGKEAHAGGSPEKGVNALKAAMLGLTAIDMQRETFRESDTIRIHPIITKGGDLVNIVPADVRVETYVRGKTIQAILDACKKVDRSLRAGALALGAEVEIRTLPGYLPNSNNPNMVDLHHKNLASLIGEDSVGVSVSHTTGSTDMGDISAIMPTIHPYGGGVRGQGHTKNYEIVDPYLAYVVPAKAMAMTAIDLLANGAAEGLRIKSEYTPLFTKETYLKMWEDAVNAE